MRKFAMACAGTALMMQPIAALAGTKDFALQGYALPANKPVTVVLMRPDVDVGELQVGGLPQPNADWTAAARTKVEAALKVELARRNIAFNNMDERSTTYQDRQTALAKLTAPCLAAAQLVSAAPGLAGAVPINPAAAPVACSPAPAALDSEAVVAQYRALHTAVVAAILNHKYGLGGGKLPTKKETFLYTLGPGAHQLGRVSGANYGLFVMTTDQFASTGRKAAQMLGALGCIIGACVIVGGGVHDSYMSLIELETGNIVWFNLLRGSKGDVRQDDGAKSMVAAIMSGMPSRPGEMMAATSATSSK